MLGRASDRTPALQAVTANKILTVAIRLEEPASYFSILQKAQEENNHIFNQNKTGPANCVQDSGYF